MHNEVRHDIRRSDARQLASTLTRDVVYPIVAVNRGDIGGLARSPRFVFDLSEPEDLASYADALPKLVGVGFQVPRSWAQERLHIPLPKEGEEVLVIHRSVGLAATVPSVDVPAELSTRSTAALTTASRAAANVELVDQLDDAAAPEWQSLIARIKTLVDQTDDMAALQRALVDAFGGQVPEAMAKLMAAGFALAELKGMSDVQDGQ